MRRIEASGGSAAAVAGRAPGGGGAGDGGGATASASSAGGGGGGGGACCGGPRYCAAADRHASNRTMASARRGIFLLPGDAPLYTQRMRRKRLGILTGGGDVPGLNS